MSNANKPAYPVSATDRAKYKSGGYVPDGVFGLTKRERAAIELRVPTSGDDDIDAMIRAANRKEFAAMAMQGFISHVAGARQRGNESVKDAHARAAVEYADALLAELERTK